MTCIINCFNNNGTFDVVLISIVIDTTRSSMIWNFSVTDNGNVCSNLYGTVSLADPVGTKINADGGTFTQGSVINSGQTLPKTATFSNFPKAGVLYEVDVSAGCYAGSIYQPEHFQR